MRSLIVLALLFGYPSIAFAAPAAPSVRVWESTKDESITEGETMLNVDPDTAYAAATDYARWPLMFPNIARVEITKQQGIDARVTLIHHGGHRDNLHFHNQPQARMVWFEDTGGRAKVWAEIVFLPGERTGTTRVRSRIYADVPGLASLLVSDATLRSLRQQRITSDLANLRAYFSAPQVGSN